jgi:hypothetical protein
MLDNRTMESRLFSIQGAIKNSLGDEEIIQNLQLVGFNKEKIRSGLVLHKAAHELYIRQIKEYGEQFAATDDVLDFRKQLRKTYMRHVKLARIAFKNDRHAYQSLGLEGDRMNSHTGLLHQMYAFYENALKSRSIQKVLADYAILEQDLKAGKAAADTYREKLNKQMDEAGEAEDFTNQRDKAFDKLDSWMSQFIQISRIALEDRPHLLEKLGVKVTEN